ncbi:hypothetical protein TNIN_392361 [Trichonephila inaurata madagascariensis]|uniref:Uncharacterized protein n=1 Tax=Trichonephila inaurata madagascariensis TaxID=2747483 RepID=A0A8X6WPK9_9ARAC|nr:hypothetical protein TNIN_392361 [Trichonephila inaurata madagascariensis]
MPNPPYLGTHVLKDSDIQNRAIIQSPPESDSRDIDQCRKYMGQYPLQNTKEGDLQDSGCLIYKRLLFQMRMDGLELIVIPPLWIRRVSVSFGMIYADWLLQLIMFWNRSFQSKGLITQSVMTSLDYGNSWECSD